MNPHLKMQIHQGWIYQIEATPQGYALQLWDRSGQNWWHRKAFASPQFAQEFALKLIEANAAYRSLTPDEGIMLSCDDFFYKGWLIQIDTVFGEIYAINPRTAKDLEIDGFDLSTAIPLIKAVIDEIEDQIPLIDAIIQGFEPPISENPPLEVEPCP